MSITLEQLKERRQNAEDLIAEILNNLALAGVEIYEIEFFDDNKHIIGGSVPRYQVKLVVGLPR